MKSHTSDYRLYAHFELAIRVERGQRRERKKFKVRFDARTPFAWHDFTEHLSKESRKSPPPPPPSCPSPRERSRLLEISTATKYRDTLTRGGMCAFEKATCIYFLYIINSRPVGLQPSRVRISENRIYSYRDAKSSCVRLRTETGRERTERVVEKLTASYLTHDLCRVKRGKFPRFRWNFIYVEVIRVKWYIYSLPRSRSKLVYENIGQVYLSGVIIILSCCEILKSQLLDE